MKFTPFIFILRNDVMKKKVIVWVSMLSLIFVIITIYIYNHSTPERTIRYHLGHVNFKYDIFNSDMVDPVYGQGYTIGETDGKFRDNISHFFYLKYNGVTWRITMGGNAP